MGSGATGAMADAKSAATTNPGKGNWWTAADTNGDGKLSPTEAAANAGVNARFPNIDLDKDGFVTQDEYRDFFTRNASQGEQHAAAHSMVVTRDVWLKLDADADSKLSVAEATGDAGLSARFTSVDANKDGFVTQDEYRAYTKANMK
jgi:Ca2+-binding EF-hand superfamily protein